MKEDPSLNAKVLKATDVYIKNMENLTKLNTHLQEVIETYRQISTNHLNLAEMLRENDSPSLTKSKLTQDSIKSDLALLKPDTANIKAMIIEIFCAFKGQSFSTHTRSTSTPTLAITNVNVTFGGENSAQIISDKPFILILEKSLERQTGEEKETPSQPEGEQVDMVTEEAKPKEPKESKVLEQEPQVVNKVEVKTLRSKEFVKHQDAHLQILSRVHKGPSLPRRKSKAIELEPETYIAGVHCNRKLPKGVEFVKNLVIEEPQHGLFFIEAFGEETFQRVSDIHNVETETLL
ncbi:hypothetical protein Tco_0327389 [Tanacetum coccineum]